jgi:hypothetical protein
MPSTQLLRIFATENLQYSKPCAYLCCISHVRQQLRYYVVVVVYNVDIFPFTPFGLFFTFPL